MKDRYLFKAKRVDNGEWVTGQYVKGLDMYDKEVHLIFEPTTIFYSSGETDGWSEIDPSTICQYSTESGLAESDCNGQVVWDDETISFQVTNRLSAESYEVLDECSIIGNIFDNKELLESEG